MVLWQMVLCLSLRLPYRPKLLEFFVKQNSRHFIDDLFLQKVSGSVGRRSAKNPFKKITVQDIVQPPRAFQKHDPALKKLFVEI
jgi:hypothetical protein